MDLAQIIEGLLLAGAVYGGIRADIKNLHDRQAATEKSTERAHFRIDDLIKGK